MLSASNRALMAHHLGSAWLGAELRPEHKASLGIDRLDALLDAARAEGREGGRRTVGADDVAFTIPGDPRGKGRPRATAYVPKGQTKAKARTFTDSKTDAYENRVTMAAAAAMAGRTLLDGPLQIEVTARLVPAASASKRARSEMLGSRWACKKPDLDNVVKAILDGCNGVVFHDDVTVTREVTEKVWAEMPGVDVVIRPLRPGVAR